jgi:hypothetical protein
MLFEFFWICLNFLVCLILFSLPSCCQGSKPTKSATNLSERAMRASDGQDLFAHSHKRFLA